MPEQISPAEAAEALRQVELSRAAFRTAIRAFRGYQHLWLWGGVWVGQCLSWHFRFPHSGMVCNLLALAGVVGSTFIGMWQGRQVRVPVDRRYLAALAAVIGFGIVVWPTVLSGHRTAEAYWTYSALVAMQAYIVTGVWFDNHLLWVGLIVAALILVGFHFFLPIFWIWMAVFGGGTLIASGFYVRSAWK